MDGGVLFLEVSDGIMTVGQVKTVVRHPMRKIAEMAIPERRQHSCPRAISQPLSSWPRLLKSTHQQGAVECDVSPITA